MPPRSSNVMLIGGLSALILVSALLGGNWFNGIAGAVGFYIFGDRLVAWLIASKTGPDGDDTPDDNLDPALNDVLARLETTRLTFADEIAQRMRTRLPLGLACGVALWAWMQFDHNPPGLIELSVFSAGGATAGWGWASAALAERYRQMYKHEVLPVLASSFGALTYRAAQGLDLETLGRQRLFKDFDRYDAEDEIAGDYHGVPISIVELKLEKRVDKSVTTIFDGLLARVTLPRTLSGTTAVIADGGLFGGLRDLFGREGQRVRLEDPAFEARYQVFGSDQIAARALLTPAFMERFLALGERTGFMQPVALAEDNRLTIALPKSGYDDLFEPPSYSRPAASRTALAKLHADIAAVLAVTDAVLDLDQSVRGRSAQTS